jgi:cytochrome c5
MTTIARNLVCFLGLTAASALAADATAGKTVYDSKCKTCHAADGTGNQGLAKALKAEIKPMSSPDIQKMSDDDLKKVVSAGFGKMKAVSSVTGADLDNVVAFLRTFKK